VLVENWRRVSSAQRILFSALASDLKIDVEQLLPTEDVTEQVVEEPLSHLENRVIAIYSLNESAIKRVKQILEDKVAAVRVLLFSDTAGGSPALKTAAETADFFVMVTGSATHSATNFIQQHRPNRDVIYPSGKGSASILRALEELPIH
jgi:hypothetical protein